MTAGVTRPPMLRSTRASPSLIPRVSAGSTRQSTALVWLAAGADPKVVQRVLGHASAAMTMDLYGHLVDDNLWQAAQVVVGGISGASEPYGQPNSGDDEAKVD